MNIKQEITYTGALYFIKKQKLMIFNMGPNFKFSSKTSTCIDNNKYLNIICNQSREDLVPIIKNNFLAVKKIILFFVLLINISICFSNEKKVFYFEINREIGPAAWRITKKALDQALSSKSDYVLLKLNTYGGLVDDADSIRTKILNCPIPVIVFIDNNAASAGALIAISADSIYMREGASIGAATVVDQQGKVVPDKYQSYMRAIMRATAEAHGKKPIIKGKDTTWIWHRDPKIAEAMVDPRTYIKGLNDTGKVLTMTTNEAIEHGYCEGKAENVKQVLEKANIDDYSFNEYKVRP